MQRLLLLTTIAVLFIVPYLPLSHSGVPNSRYEAMMKRESQLPGLYNDSDKVVILTGNTFKQFVVGKNYASLVEFYNSYCGHCKRFAPVYKDLAESTWSWRDVIKVMAIDCAAEENNDVCREYEVMAYPTMRYFGPSYQPSQNNYGTPIKNQDPDVIRDSMATLVANETAPTNYWPNFSNLTEDEVVNLFKDLPAKIKYVVIVLDTQNNSAIGAQTILNFNRYPELYVRQVSDEKLAGKFYINSTNRIGAVDRNVGVELLHYQENTAQDYKDALAKFVKLNRLSEKPELATEKVNETNLLIDEEVRKEAEREKEIIKEVKRNKHMVYQADLEQAIHYILNNEIPRVGNISGERLLALQRLMNVLKRYHPLGPNGRVLIDKLQEFVTLKNQLLTGKEFEEKVKQLETELSPVFSSSRYIGCIGSKQNYRGFTCSLWKLFHYLTVQAYIGEKSNDPLEVLQALHGFVKYYFGCTDCSQHFQEMAQRRKIWSTPSKDEAVLWLWEAHNEVNNRLAGDDTEDPEFPKIQFPSKSSCQLCQKNTTNPQESIVWDRDAVLSFLKNINNPSYISRYGLDDPDILHPSIEKLRQKRMIGNVFSDMDMRMGMLLYGFCIVMMILAFKLFAFKGYRKKPYAHDFLGKV